MRQNLISFSLCIVLLMVACSSGNRNDGRAISERLVKTAVVDSAFVSQLVMGLDTLMAPEILGRDFAMTIVSEVERDTVLNGKELNKRIMLLKRNFEKYRGEKYFERFAEGVQSYVGALPLEKEMKLYVKLSTPAQLGTALRIDRYRYPHDTVKIAEKVKIVSKIYNDVEYASFLKYYNRK